MITGPKYIAPINEIAIEIEKVLTDKSFIDELQNSNVRWLDDPLEQIQKTIIDYLYNL